MLPVEAASPSGRRSRLSLLKRHRFVLGMGVVVRVRGNKDKSGRSQAVFGGSKD